MEQKTTKKKITGCVIAALVTFVVLAGLLLTLFRFYIGPRLAEDKRAEIIHPAIIVHEPAEGDTVFMDESLTASATATSANPIARLELWLNGEKFLEQIPVDLSTTFYASFEVFLPEGYHLLVFRAVDREGLVAQSAPITVISEQAIAELVIEDEGQTLEDIADALEEEPGVLKDMNPDLGDENLPAGTNVKVPQPPPQEGGDIIVGDPDPEPGQGSVIDIANMYAVSEKRISVGTIDLIAAALADMRPNAPSSFHAEYDDCMIELRWQDNAENETHFNIWMQRVYGPPQLIASTGNNPDNSPTSFTFQSPGYGFYNFWVEAANALGGQPSEIKKVFVSDQTCKHAIATYLEIEARDMYSYSSPQGYYCYLSVEGTDFRRIPEGDGAILVQNNWGDITSHWGGDKRIIFPMPADEELTLEGYCMAKLGPLMVAPIRPFKVSVPREKWDGSRLEINTEDFLIGYHVQPTGSETASGRFEFVDYDLDPPQIWNVEAQAELQFPEKDWKARTVDIDWHWASDADKLQNFLIRINGKDHRYVSKIQRKESILLGTACGGVYAFEMVAVGPSGARSAPGNTYIYNQPPCPVMAEVQFISVISDSVDDTDCIPPFMHTCLPYTGASCHQIGVFYELWAKAEGQDKIRLQYGSDQLSFAYQCDIEYQFSKQLGADQDTILIPISPSSTSIRVGTTFWDSDDFGNDKFGVIDQPITFDYDVWPTVDQVFTFKAPMMGETADATVKIRVRGYYQPGP